jgi:ATP-dependent helicase/nuclease subunit A
LPPDAVRKGDPAVRLARKVSAKIRMLLDSGRESVEDSDTGHRRPVRPGDIMILVRTRGPFFQAIVRALKNESVAVAGADRLDVVGHIAVMDCLAAAQAALVPDDDLAVATVFTSPLGGLDDTDLIALAPRRTGTLTQALETSADERHRALAARLAGWRDLAAGATPFEFFSLVLGAQLGRQHLVGRLGSEADDALDEFLALALAHERQGPPSLKRFLAEMAGLSFDVKRDLESAGDAVRVMTVHGAKGLEAKIVFLPDTCGSLSREGNDPKLFALPAGGSQVLAWPGVKAEDTDVMVAARQRLKEEEENESRRLLYVAMTRAEERLYIAGSYKVRKSSVTWHAMIDEALRPVSDEIDDPLEKGGRILRMGGIEDAGLLEPVSSRALPGVAPEWLFEPATPEQDATPPLRPSSVLAGADAREPLASARTQALRRGVAIHTLLRRLPDLVPDARAESARAYLAGSFPDLSSAHDAMTASVLAVIDDPVLEPLFGAASLAEIPLVARIERSGGRAPIEIAGQIDRLAETPDAIWLADYKTGVAPAGLPPEAHIAQMALYAAALRQIYPGRPVRAVLIYTQEPRVVTLAPEAIKAALSNVLAQGQAA